MAERSAPQNVTLTNSQRRVSKATYAPARLPSGTPSAPQVLEKAAFARSLAITEEELSALQPPDARAQPSDVVDGAFTPETLKLVAEVTQLAWPDTLKRFGPDLAQTSREELAAVGLALLDLRRCQAGTARETVNGEVPSSTLPATPSSLQPAREQGSHDIALQTEVAVRAFQFLFPEQPIGALHLERLELTPAGVEHGQLVHSVPLTPGETVNIAHREWTVTTNTFESIIQDSFEGFSETGVTDKTDLSQALESETKHSTALDINGSVTASYDGGAYSVTAAAAADYSSQEDVRNSIKQSAAHAVAVTRAASARTRKEHKNSFRVSSVAGTEDLAVRTLTNRTPEAVRVDYFQLMRKWRVDLIRYGLRLTYDLVIPNPGIDLMEKVLELQGLSDAIALTHTFGLKLSDVIPERWAELAAAYGATLDPPPDPQMLNYSQSVSYDIPRDDDLASRYRTFGSFEFDIEAGYEIIQAVIGVDFLTDRSGDGIPPELLIYIDQQQFSRLPQNWGGEIAALHGRTGKVVVPYSIRGWTGRGNVRMTVAARVTSTAIRNWTVRVWNQLREAEQLNYQANLQRMRDRKAALEAEIGQFDALTLRKMEHEEVTKWVLKWLLGGLPLESSPVSVLGEPWPPGATQPPSGFPGSPVLRGIDPARLQPPEEKQALQRQVLQYGEFVKFIHNAVEWENMLFLSYPYFWDAAANWPFKRFLLHPDPVHREFLRAGAVRVVLTIRPGFEDAFLRLVLTGDPQGQPDEARAPYISVGQEVHNQDLTNYQNIPPANPDRRARTLLYPLQQAAWDEMQSIIGALEEFKNKNGHYPPGPEKGLPRVLKTFLLGQPPIEGGVKSFAAMLWDHLKTVPVAPAGKFDDPNATFIDPWRNPYHYQTSTATTRLLRGEYELVCYGSDNAPGSKPDDPLSEDITSWAEGLLVAQWYEYTPTSALDVSVDKTLSIDGPPLAG